MAEEGEVLSERELSESIDEDIRKTLHEINERNASAADDAPAEPAAESEPEAEAAAPAADKPRAADGKFVKPPKESAAPAKADTPTTPAAAPATEQAAAEPADAPLVTTKGKPIDISRAPSSWKPAAKAVWASLAEPVRAEIHRREMEYHHGYGDIKVNADFGQSVRTVVEPYRMLIEAEGATPERAIADTMRTAALFRVGTQAQKTQALLQLDHQFNGGLKEYIAGQIAQHAGQIGVTTPQAQQAQQFADPRVDELLRGMQAQERERTAQAERASNSAVENFMSAKDAKGEPLYPFVDNVLEDMSQRVASLRRQNPALEHAEALKQAYDAAVWANPETRAVLMGQQQAQAAQPADTQRKVEAAKRASAVNVPKRGALPATGPAQSLDDTIRDTGRALGLF